MAFVIRKADIPQEDVPPQPLTPEETQVSRVMRTAVNDLESAAMTNAVQEAISTRNYEAIQNAMPLDQTAEMINTTANTFGQVIMDKIGSGLPNKVGMAMRFDYTDPRATEWAVNQSARLVTAVTEEMRQQIRNVIGQAFTNNTTVKDTARALKQFIGLNARQQNTLEKFIAANAGNPNLDKMIEAQKKKMIAYRADMIARTEIIQAESNGRQLGWTQAIEGGWASKNSMKRWSAAVGSERTCEDCRHLDGISVRWDQPFTAGIMDAPAHVMCRCSTTLLEPDSALAQNTTIPDNLPAYVEPPKTPMPIKAVATLEGLQNIEGATSRAETSKNNTGVFQYDSGAVENLNVTTQPVVFNGSPHTEVRFKLTEDTKTQLARNALRDQALPTPKWHVAKDVAVIDKKVGKEVTFTSLGSTSQESNQIYMESMSSGYQNQKFQYFVSGTDNATYTRFMSDGTAVRFVVSPNDAYALDGQVRVMIPGNATKEKIDAIMSELGVTASRYPAQADVEALKVNRIISTFAPTFKTSGDLAAKTKKAESIVKKMGFTLADVKPVLSAEGDLRFEIPQSGIDYLKEQTGVKYFEHNLGRFASGMEPDQQIDAVVSLFTDNPRLMSTTNRYLSGVQKEGMSSKTDMQTGGADYVFLRPRLFESSRVGMYNIRFDANKILSRTDYYAYRKDAYGVLNPYQMDFYAKRKTLPNSIQEMKNASNSAEIMLRDSVDMSSATHIGMPSDYVRDGVLSRLKSMGITEWNGKPIDEVIVI
jgi:Phage Mu protein F like protein